MSSGSKEDLVVSGSKSALWLQRGRLLNTDRETLGRTFESVDESFKPWDSYRNYSDGEHENRELTLNFTDYIHEPTMEKTRKNVTFHKRGGGTITVLGHQNGNPPGSNLNGYESKLQNGSSISRYNQKHLDTQWYTRPLHLDRKATKKTTENSSSSTKVPPARPSSPSHANRSETTADSLLSYDNKLPNGSVLDSADTSDVNENNKDKPGQGGLDSTLTPMDSLARDNFPVTLGAAYDNLTPCNSELSNGNVPTNPHSPTDLPLTDHVPWKSTCSKSSGKGKTRPGSGHSSSSSRSRSRRSRPNSAQSSSSSASKGSLDRMYLMAAEAPVTAGSPAVLVSSPYTSELARLRMDRLRIEEEQLLEIKRQEELERIRGPMPKWYELRTPRFHYEAHKNNDLLDNKQDWQALMDYRNDLERASTTFHKTYTSTATSS